MKITKTNPLTGQEVTKDLPVTQEQLDRWKAGQPIQYACPHLNADDREFIMTGITNFDEMFRNA